MAAPDGGDDVWAAGDGSLCAIDARYISDAWPDSNDRLALRRSDIAHANTNCDIDGTHTPTPSVTPTPSITPTPTASPTGTPTPTSTQTLIPVLITTPDAVYGVIVVTAQPGFTPAPSPAAELSTCDCFGDNVLTCESFASPFEAQSCFLRCKQMTGVDIHALDLDGDQNACAWNATPVTEQSTP